MAQKQITTRSEFWFGFVTFVVILGGLLLGSYWLLSTLLDEEQLPITGVILQGERVYVADQEIIAALLEKPMGSFFTANADALRQQVEALPWVYSASVRKEWPRSLRLYLVEQVPVAAWNQAWILNEQGEVVEAHPSRVQQALPALEGPENSALEVFETYQKTQALLQAQAYQIEKFVMSDRFSVTFWLVDGMEVRLGREALLQRVQRFMDILPVVQAEAEARASEITYIDLRYDTGVAVGWNQGLSDEKSDRKK